ncbi:MULTISPECIES: DUF4190 domain-containing protein [unclassified Pseudonocardia]|uniref:DUF4190 domain-containing protein n=1 Tax=unclassified Pseudonocardia TaxID=2619320 RepID=UPI000705EAFC|nr:MULTISPECIES: DUF4190 domain-containing protein [unclassified Pseudonocardia]ALL79061.1 hypothetical protein AD006_23570 [Pseudonocardia sp. EC080610-09]OLM17732.1 hypothetical protein Ae707Ps1_1991 [Pseudonocardia sp. Ae707_Ps1]
MSSDDRDPRPGGTPGDDAPGGAGYGPGAAGPPPWAAGPPGYGGPPGPYPGWGPAYPPPRPTNGMAIASLVLGILWLYGLGSILALVLGYVAKRQIAERGEQGGGLATAGIVLGWIGVAVLVVAIVFFVGIAAFGMAGNSY